MNEFLKQTPDQRLNPDRFAVVDIILQGVTGIIFSARTHPVHRRQRGIDPECGKGAYQKTNDTLRRIEKETGVNQGRRQRKGWLRNIFRRNRRP